MVIGGFVYIFLALLTNIIKILQNFNDELKKKVLKIVKFVFINTYMLQGHFVLLLQTTARNIFRFPCRISSAGFV